MTSHAQLRPRYGQLKSVGELPRLLKGFQGIFSFQYGVFWILTHRKNWSFQDFRHLLQRGFQDFNTLQKTGVSRIYTYRKKTRFFIIFLHRSNRLSNTTGKYATDYWSVIIVPTAQFFSPILFPRVIEETTPACQNVIHMWSLNISFYSYRCQRGTKKWFMPSACIFHAHILYFMVGGGMVMGKYFRFWSPSDHSFRFEIKYLR